MNGFPPELIYILILAAILFFQYLMKWFGPQQQQDSAQNEPVPEISEAVSPVSGASVDPVGIPGGATASPPLSRRRFTRRSLMGTRRDVQNAIIITTILGPCRAFEPHDIR